MPWATIYTDISHFDSAHRGELIDLLKPFWGKSPDFTDQQRVALYGISEKDIAFTDSLKTADLAVLPMSWNYYTLQQKLDQATGFVKSAQQAGKKVLSCTGGDFGVRIPHFDNLIVLRQSGYRSKLPAYHQGMPAFITDPLERYYGRKEIFLREKQEKPIIGFCGQAKGSLKKYAVDIARTAWRNTQYHLGWSPYDPQDLYPSTLRRSKVLDKIEDDPRLIANFIKRVQYRAGAHTEAERWRTALEFYDNMIHSDYVVCLRGGGNFSVRLYETLAMGRIPVFINTDCMLPMADQINWKEHAVWVERDKIDKLPETILDFHFTTGKYFEEIQQNNRILWLDKLRLSSFFQNYLNQYTLCTF